MKTVVAAGKHPLYSSNNIFHSIQQSRIGGVCVCEKYEMKWICGAKCRPRMNCNHSPAVVCSFARNLRSRSNCALLLWIYIQTLLRTLQVEHDAKFAISGKRLWHTGSITYAWRLFPVLIIEHPGELCCGWQSFTKINSLRLFGREVMIMSSGTSCFIFKCDEVIHQQVFASK